MTMVYMMEWKFRLPKFNLRCSLLFIFIYNSLGLCAPFSIIIIYIFNIHTMNVHYLIKNMTETVYGLGPIFIYLYCLCLFLSEVGYAVVWSNMVSNGAKHLNERLISLF